MSDATEADRFVAQVAADWREAPLGPADRALCAYAETVTKDPAGMTAERLDPLRGAGFEDGAIHDAVQVIAYFNYINRVADALGVDHEAWLHAWEAR